MDSHSNAKSSNGREPWLQGIEGEALPKLIMTDSHVVRVVAGPGSGKTLGLKRRALRLIQGDKIEADKIFVGTFTRAIATELANSLGVSTTTEEISEAGGNIRIEVSTLHSHALRLIRSYPTACPGRSLRFLLGYEQDVMLYDVGEGLTELPKQRQRRRELKRVCAAWAEGTDLKLAGFLGEMDRWLRRYDGMLIDEVVNLARVALEAGDLPVGQFDHVIIDEYQDLTAAEQRLVEKIWSGKGSLIVLGDNDQSIYSFRYNHPRGIEEFKDRWSKDEFEDIPIPDNRRCGKTIVALANTMMAEAGSKKAPMLPKRPEDGELALVYWPSVGKEISGLSKYVRERPDTKFLILVSRRFIGYKLKKAIGAEALTSFHEEALELALLQERFALASFVANPKDRIALRTLLGFSADGCDYGPKRNANAYRKIADSQLQGAELLDAIASGQLKISGTGSSHVKSRAKKVLDFLGANSRSQTELLGALFDPNLAAALQDDEVKEKARRDLDHLRDSAISIGAEMIGSDIGRILDQLRYRIAMRIPLSEPKEARVHIMTCHGAKGLEADVVIIAGVADQIIPGISFGDPTEAMKLREEERRLLYVSVTRAKRELVLSWPQNVKYQDATRNQIRIDRGSVWRQGDTKWVRLSRSKLLPDISQQPETGQSWLKRRLN